MKQAADTIVALTAERDALKQQLELTQYDLQHIDDR